MKVTAYLLRRQGLKIKEKDAIRATAVTGRLIVKRRGSGTETVARLLDDDGKALLHELSSPSVAISDEGVMVRGTNVVIRTAGPVSVRQAWWCVPVDGHNIPA